MPVTAVRTMRNVIMDATWAATTLALLAAWAYGAFTPFFHSTTMQFQFSHFSMAYDRRHTGYVVEGEEKGEEEEEEQMIWGPVLLVLIYGPEVAVLLGEEEEAGADGLGLPGQDRGRSLGSAPPGRQLEEEQDHRLNRAFGAHRGGGRGGGGGSTSGTEDETVCHLWLCAAGQAPLSSRSHLLVLAGVQVGHGVLHGRGHVAAVTATELSAAGPLRLLRLPRLLSPEVGTPATAEGTMLEAMFMEGMELGGENMGWDDRGLTFMELKNGKLLAESGLLARLLVAQLLSRKVSTVRKGSDAVAHPDPPDTLPPPR
ncbi:hypothetical protein EYF80_044147 [Liparis tanakae]|uniref:Uncharacterized protein n=1 Tax=Liparis tanakae TaxID=230148 RepID=A0A4Z2FWP7_9TELE|nr:hypothetical protein EYF80_044147 [Liparis tanakae]